MMQWILLLIYIFSILSVIFIERKNPTEAILWIFVMVCLPYVGTILYFIFGNTTFIKWVYKTRKKRLNQLQINPLPEKKMENLSSEDEQVMHFNYVYNQSPITHYQTIQTYIDGKSHYEQLFKDIENAKENIYVEFYTIHNDCVGQTFQKALCKKAKSGVHVYVLCDSFANLSTPKNFFDPSIHVIRVKPYLTHYRSHRKIVVIDEEIAYIGGMNIGKQYANMAKKKNPWRDSQVRLTGDCVYVLLQYFLQDWLCAVKKNEVNAVVEKIESISIPVHTSNQNLCQFIVGGVNTHKESVKMVYLSMIRSAKQRIRIQSPYFIPDASILDALKTAAAAGIQIELMIPGIKASFFLDPVTTYYSGQLLEYGAKIYKYNGYIHAKTMMIDDEICAIGSVNMDIRSLMVDDEICGIFYENTFVKEYADIYDADILCCKPYTLKQYENRSQKEKMQEGFFLLFAPLM